MPLVLWSGGCDSTLLLRDLLAKYSGGAGLNEYPPPVRTISFTHPNVCAGDENRRARDAIYPILTKRFGHFERLEVAISSAVVGTDRSGDPASCAAGVIQPAIWLFHSALALGDTEDLYAGYVNGDDAIKYRSQIDDAFRAMQQMTYRTGELRTPFAWTTKATVIRRLKEEGLHRHVWWCEAPHDGKKGKPCGGCKPCKTHRTALWQIEQGID